VLAPACRIAVVHDARMREWVRGLSFRSEFTIVFFVAFGLPLMGTVLSFLAPEWWTHGAALITNARLLRTLIFEVVVGSLLWQVLVLRGWTGAQVGLSLVRPWSREFLTTPVVALGLTVAIYVSYAILLIAAVSVWPGLIGQTHRLQVAPGLPMGTVLAVALINPVFEEVFVCGYVISSLRGRLGVANAVNVSAAIRVAYHLYQGPIGVLGITPFALIAGVWFARTKRLAPLVLAHALIDFTGLTLASWKLP
jgi:membrane protease YdiL (CAAX protease family)